MKENATGEGTATPAAEGTNQNQAANQQAAQAQSKEQGKGGGEASQAQAGEKKDVTVPLDVVESMRTELKNLKAEKATLQDQNRLYQTQLGVMAQTGRGGQASPAPAPEPAADPLQGMDGDDIMTVQDVRKVLKSINTGTNNQEISRLSGIIAKLEVAVNDPNYEQTIRDYLPEVVNSNPGLYQTIQASPNPLTVALALAKTNPRYITAQQAGNKGAGGDGGQPRTDIMDQINQIIENQNKPGSTANAGGGGVIDAASKFLNMSDDELEAHKQKVLSGQV